MVKLFQIQEDNLGGEGTVVIRCVVVAVYTMLKFKQSWAVSLAHNSLKKCII